MSDDKEDVATDGNCGFLDPEFINDLAKPSLTARPILIRCYMGAVHGVQREQLMNAGIKVAESLSVEIKLELIHHDEIRKFRPKWTVEDLIEWLLAGHIHFIATHIHQGTENFGWDITHLYSMLQSHLFCHKGFPSGSQLSCPIFTQDKYEYLRLLPEEFVMPTLKVPLHPSMDMADVETLVSKFMEGKPVDFVVKAPFVTNSQHFKSYVNSVAKAMQRIKSVFNDLFVNNYPSCYVIPYIMLQSRVSHEM
jgi:hypothetical protein